MTDLDKRQPEGPDLSDDSQPPAESGGGGGGGALVELPEEAVLRLERELATVRDQLLRTAADFENYRKRIARERAELWAKAQVELVVRLIDALDDLARFALVEPAQTDAKTLHDGIEMVQRKVWKELQAIGIVRIDQTGVPFDPRFHEAVTTAPAATDSQDHTVGAVLQAGYKLGDTLIRAARVQVLTWKSGSGDGEGGR